MRRIGSATWSTSRTRPVGKTFTKGQECGVVESVKAAADIYAPVSGEVVAVNDELIEQPREDQPGRVCRLDVSS